MEKQPIGSCAMALLAALLMSSPGCSSRNLQEEAGPPAPPLQRTVRIAVDFAGSGTAPFGDRREWLDALIAVFEDMEVCACVVGEDEEAAAGDADMAVSITIQELPPASPSIDPQGAFLDFLAWSAVPPVQLWIPDVHVDPGIAAFVKVATLPAAEELERGGGRLECPAIKSSILERHPFLSWTTLGSVLLPPFIFREPDRVHLGTSIARSVRRAVAEEAAGMIRSARLKAEFLSDLNVYPGLHGGLVLSYRPAPLLKYLDLKVQGGGTWSLPVLARKPRIPIPGDAAAQGGSPQEEPLDELLAGLTGDDLILRIEALDRDGRRLRYTVPLPALEKGRMAREAP